MSAVRWGRLLMRASDFQACRRSKQSTPPVIREAPSVLKVQVDRELGLASREVAMDGIPACFVCNRNACR